MHITRRRRKIHTFFVTNVKRTDSLNPGGNSFERRGNREFYLPQNYDGKSNEKD